jgi:hypothetical protein
MTGNTGGRVSTQPAYPQEKKSATFEVKPYNLGKKEQSLLSLNTFLVANHTLVNPPYWWIP